MSDVMLFGVLKMPYEMAMSSELSRLQFYQRVQQLVARVEAQPEQEPSITKTGCGILTLHLGFDDLPDGTKFYTTPPKRPWVGLTDDEIIAADMHTLRVRGDGYTYARALEDKLKALNT